MLTQEDIEIIYTRLIGAVSHMEMYFANLIITCLNSLKLSPLYAYKILL